MKKCLLFLPILLVLTACAPTEAQIQAALEQTRIAQPTNTPYPEPTNPPTAEPTTTPDVPHLKALTYQNVYDMYLSAGIPCADREINPDGSYKQDCNWIISDGVIQGEIVGNSENTVRYFIIMFVPKTGENLNEKIEQTFIEFSSFGDQAGEMQFWINKNLPAIFESQTELEFTQEFADVTLLLSGSIGIALLGVIANP
jgi:hypothetical protein